MNDQNTPPTSNTEAEIMADPTTSHWLKEQLTCLHERDLVDSINDSEVLLQVLKQRLETMAAHASLNTTGEHTQ